MINLDQFVTKYTGQTVPNNHGGYSGECVSLAARYAQEVEGVPDGDATFFCQKTGGARDLYESPTTLELQYYDLIPFGQPRQRGDLVVWGANLGKYGDVAVALDGATQIFGQLGTPVFIPANTRSETRPPLGYLRRKGDNNDMTNNTIEKLVSNIYRVATDVDPTPEQANYWVERIKADQNTAPELPIALGAGDYKNDPMFRYKGRHYDEDMKTKYQQGLTDGGGEATLLGPGRYQVN